MAGLTDVRRSNIRRLIQDKGGLTKLSKSLGYRNPSFLSQMTGPEPTRGISEKTARRIEVALALAYLDAVERGGPRTDHVKQLVRLAK